MWLDGDGDGGGERPDTWSLPMTGNEALKSSTQEGKDHGGEAHPKVPLNFYDARDFDPVALINWPFARLLCLRDLPEEWWGRVVRQLAENAENFVWEAEKVANLKTCALGG